MIEAPAIDFAQILFEASPADEIAGRRVYTIRYELGRALGRQIKDPVFDSIVPLPLASTPVALGIAHETNRPFNPTVGRCRYIEPETFDGKFIFNGQDESDKIFKGKFAFLGLTREEVLRLGLTIIPELITGKKILITDTCVFTGEKMRLAVKMFRDAQAAEVHAAVASPPISSLENGFRPQERLIAKDRSLDQICAVLGLDSIHYLSERNFLSALGLDKSMLKLPEFRI